MLEMTIDENFQSIAVKEYNNKNKTTYNTFAELQQKLENGTDILCEDQYFGIIRIEKSMPSFCKWVIPPVYLKSKKADEKEKLALKNKRQENEKKINEYINNNF